MSRRRILAVFALVALFCAVGTAQAAECARDGQGATSFLQPVPTYHEWQFVDQPIWGDSICPVESGFRRGCHHVGGRFDSCPVGVSR